MKVKLDYGRTGLEVHVPDANLEGVLGLQPAPPLEDPTAAVRAALANPVGRPPLAELARGKRSACVVISDITRPVPNPILLPPLLATLEEAGVPRDGITLLNATGTHRPNTPEEFVQMVGPQVAASYRIVNHVATDLDTHRYLGETKRGVPIWVDSRFLDAELKLSCALIEPHFMAGYSGGR
jgi:nickel-dependent lactate racemase